eukprot:8161156-Pyramimonas_sp.AAC.1
MAGPFPTNDRMIRVVPGGTLPAATPAVVPETDLTHQMSGDLPSDSADPEARTHDLAADEEAAEILFS